MNNTRIELTFFNNRPDSKITHVPAGTGRIMISEVPGGGKPYALISSYTKDFQPLPLDARNIHKDGKVYVDRGELPRATIHFNGVDIASDTQRYVLVSVK